MVTQKNTPWNNQTEYYGLSGDSKPSGVRNGDKFVEINTGKTFLYNETGAAWVEQPASGGGGGGGSSDFSTAVLSITNVGRTKAGYSTDSNQSAIIQIIENILLPRINTATEDGDYTIVLYKGHAYGCFICSEEVTTYSGDITLTQGQDGDEWICEVDITGDCSITLKGWEDN